MRWCLKLRGGSKPGFSIHPDRCVAYFCLRQSLCTALFAGYWFILRPQGGPFCCRAENLSLVQNNFFADRKDGGESDMVVMAVFVPTFS